MATYQKFNQFSEDLVEGIHDWDNHTFKVALTNTAPTSANAVLADITQISAGTGYTTGGTATTITTSEVSGTTTVQGTEVVFTATGSMGPFRYVVLYNDTPTSPADPLVAWWDYGSSITLAASETFTVRFNNTTPGTIFTLA